MGRVSVADVAAYGDDSYTVPVAAQQLVHGLVEGLAQGVPDGVVNCSYGLCYDSVLAHVDCMQASPGQVDRSVPHAFPVTLHVPYVLPDQHWGEDVVHDLANLYVIFIFVAAIGQPDHPTLQHHLSHYGVPGVDIVGAPVKGPGELPDEGDCLYVFDLHTCILICPTRF